MLIQAIAIWSTEMTAGEVALQGMSICFVWAVDIAIMVLETARPARAESTARSWAFELDFLVHDSDVILKFSVGVSPKVALTALKGFFLNMGQDVNFDMISSVESWGAERALKVTGPSDCVTSQDVTFQIG